MAHHDDPYTGALSREGALTQLGNLDPDGILELASMRYDFTDEHQRWLTLVAARLERQPAQTLGELDDSALDFCISGEER